MKKNIIITCILFLSSNFFADDQSFFQQAQNKFAQEKWEESLSMYEKIQNKNSLVWQNIAICLHHQQQYPQALVALKRAFAGASVAQLNQLQNLEIKIDGALQIPSPSTFYFVARKILYGIPLLVLQIIFLLLLVQLFLMMLRRHRWYDCTYQEKKYIKRIIIALFLCMGLWYLKTLFFANDIAIVIKPEVIVYAGPDTSFHNFEKLHPGTEVKIIEKQNNMYHIKIQKITGWVSTDVLEPIINHE
jgi:tetratricopeptide (TPR) repeat protein